jgi:hypothetical protein
MVKVFGWWDIAAHFTGIALGMVVNYSMNSLWTWKELSAGSPYTLQRFSSPSENQPQSFRWNDPNPITKSGTPGISGNESGRV